jgi:site-specific DNA-cytosine methylase
MFTIGSLFSGIGGLELGLERAGVGRVVWQVERDAFCRSVLERHWPHATRYDDVRSVGRSTLASVDGICGGFPCQPVSVAGKRRAQADDRWLWPDFARIVEEFGPRFVVIENVPGLRTAGLRDVLSDLARLGFDAEWSTLSAAEVGAPHGRERLFIVATHPDRLRVRDEPGWLSRACGTAAAVTRRALEGLPPADTDPLRRLEQARRFAEVGGWPGHVGWELGSIARVDDWASPRGGPRPTASPWQQHRRPVRRSHRTSVDGGSMTTMTDRDWLFHAFDAGVRGRPEDQPAYQSILRKLELAEAVRVCADDIISNVCGDNSRHWFKRMAYDDQKTAAHCFLTHDPAARFYYERSREYCESWIELDRLFAAIMACDEGAA